MNESSSPNIAQNQQKSPEFLSPGKIQTNLFNKEIGSGLVKQKMKLSSNENEEVSKSPINMSNKRVSF